MTTTSSQSQPMQISKFSNDSGLDFPLSPTEPGKFDFYRVHVTNQGHGMDSMFSDNHDSSFAAKELPKHWTPLINMKHLSESAKSSSSTSLPGKSSADESSINKPITNKPIQQVASFSSLTDAVKNAMKKGYINPTINQLRQQTNGTTVSSKDLNHLSPQSM